MDNGGQQERACQQVSTVGNWAPSCWRTGGASVEPVTQTYLPKGQRTGYLFTNSQKLLVEGYFQAGPGPVARENPRAKRQVLEGRGATGRALLTSAEVPVDQAEGRPHSSEGGAGVPVDQELRSSW